VENAFCKIKIKKKTQSEVKWANILLLSAHTHGEPAHTDAAGNLPGHVHLPEKSEAIDKHPSNTAAAPAEIMFPAGRVCALIDSASSSPSGTPRVAAWQLVLSAAAGRCQPGQGTCAPWGAWPRPCPLLAAATGAPWPLRQGRAPCPPPNNISLPLFWPPLRREERHRGGGRARAKPWKFEIPANMSVQTNIKSSTS